MNNGKTKIMFGCSTTDRVKEQGKWQCGVCMKQVGSNSTLCTWCQKRVQN